MVCRGTLTPPYNPPINLPKLPSYCPETLVETSSKYDRWSSPEALSKCPANPDSSSSILPADKGAEAAANCGPIKNSSCYNSGLWNSMVRLAVGESSVILLTPPLRYC